MGAKPWEKYIDEVLSGERVAGELERLSVERCARLMKDPRYIFDENEANRILEIVSLFRHTKGKHYGERFTLFPWQSFFFAYIFGLRHKKPDGTPGTRVTRKVLLCMAKKGGKSEIGGALGVLMTFFDGEAGGECYSAANKYDQALFSWNAAKSIVQQMARDDDDIERDFKLYDSITNRSIMDLGSDSFFRPLAADAKTLDGVNPHFALIDEYHEARDSSIPDNMESGMVAREQPLLCIITTRGFNQGGVLHQLEGNYEAILRGQAENDSVFPLIFALDSSDDWQDKEVWPKANPGIGRAPTLDGLEQEYQKALTEGATREISFRTKNMNQWTATERTWIPDQKWRKNRGKIDMPAMAGRECFLGIDMAVTRDIAGYGILFPPEHPAGKFTFKGRYYCPEEGARIRARQDRVPYLDWAGDGWITLTDGNLADFEKVKRDVLADNGQYQIISAAYDPYQAAHLAGLLSDEGMTMAEFRMTYTYMNEPIGFIEKLVEEERLIFDEDPVLRWMAGNVSMLTNTTGLRRPSKENSKEKIDGIVMLLMAASQYLHYRAEKSVYEDRGFIMF